MTKWRNLSKIVLAGLFPLILGITSCSNQEEGVVNSKDDLDSSVIGKFNCNTGEFKLTKNDFILSEILEKNKWYSKEEFILATKTSNHMEQLSIKIQVNWLQKNIGYV